MRLKKKIVLLGAVVTCINLSSAVFASEYVELLSDNNTSKYSTVVVRGLCAGASGHFTRPGQQGMKTTKTEVFVICKTQGDCDATLIVADTEDQIKRCNPAETTVIGHATLRVKDVTVTSASSEPQQPYIVNGSANRIVIASK